MILFIWNHHQGNQREYRPGYSHAWAGETYYIRIRVEPLPSTGADELLQRFLGNGEDFVPLKQHLLKRTDGSFRYTRRVFGLL